MNQIYGLIRETDKTPRDSKCYIKCYISDFEADQVPRLLKAVFKFNVADYTAKYAVMCLIKHKVDNRSLNAVTALTKQSKGQVNIVLGCTRFYLAGKYNFLSME